MTTSRPRIVLLQGAFDILNYGHIRAFKFAKAQGDYLIVALNTNELIRAYKGREPVMLWSQKRRIIEACRYVDKVVPAREFSPLKLLKRYRVDVYVLSREWEHTKAAEIAFIKQQGGRVCFSRRFHGVSTSAIKATLLKEHLDAQGSILQSAAVFGRGNEHIRNDALFGAAAANGATVIPLRGRQSRQAGAGVFNGRGT
jgi:glycerol-3-phosphate cytidylyltransferase